jgi:phospholipase C
VLSPRGKAHGVSNVVHDHTSVLATIEHKWNLPPLTYRDANANTMMDFLDLKHPPALLKPPKLAAPGNSLGTMPSCDGSPISQKMMDKLAPVTKPASRVLGELGF